MQVQRVDYDNQNTPILYNSEIDEFAQDVLKDYKPSLLRKPGTINYEHFLESYLGLTIMYKNIYNANPNKQILALAVFRDGTTKIFDRENERVSNIIVKANTVIIDNYVLEQNAIGFDMFTGLHEAGHFLLHREVFSVFRAGQLCCRQENKVGHNQNAKQKTAEQWREHHANYFAAAIAMPNATFNPFVNQILRENHIYKRNIVLGRNEDSDILATELLPEYISETYGVSKQAALIKLKKNNFII